VFQPILPLHECADPVATEFAAAVSVVDPLHSDVDSATEPLQSIADSVGAGAAPIETS
jgi:hypothetical protein